MTFASTGVTCQVNAVPPWQGNTCLSVDATRLASKVCWGAAPQDMMDTVLRQKRHTWKVVWHEVLLEALKQQEAVALFCWQVCILCDCIPPPGLGLGEVSNTVEECSAGLGGRRAALNRPVPGEGKATGRADRQRVNMGGLSVS